MSINFFELEEISKQMGLSLENTEKELFHNIILFSLFNFNRLRKYAKHLAFKGGTCLYKCYGFPRFSEDLDFDIIAKKLSKKNIDVLFNRDLTNTLRKTFRIGNLNFEINDNPTGFNIRADIRGPAFSQTHRSCHLKFDLSSRKRLIYDVNEVKHNASLFLKPYNLKGIINMKAVKPKEICAEKIVAILDKEFIFGQRDEAMDLFDLYILLLNGHDCQVQDVEKKLPANKKDVFTLKNLSKSIYHTAKPNEWDMMIDQLIIRSKLNEHGLCFEDLDFDKVSRFVIKRLFRKQ